MVVTVALWTAPERRQMSNDMFVRMESTQNFHPVGLSHTLYSWPSPLFLKTNTIRTNPFVKELAQVTNTWFVWEGVVRVGIYNCIQVEKIFAECNDAALAQMMTADLELENVTFDQTFVAASQSNSRNFWASPDVH